MNEQLLIEPRKIEPIYEWMSQPIGTSAGDIAFTFGRDDPMLAECIADLVLPGHVEYAVVSGGTGKDSGSLKIPEADFVGDIAVAKYHVPKHKLIRETKATHGGENVRFGIDKIVEHELPHENMVVIAHHISGRRLYEMFRTIKDEKNFAVDTLALHPTHRRFDRFNLKDLWETTAEFARILNWTASGSLLPVNIPNDLRELREYTLAIEPVLKAAVAS